MGAKAGDWQSQGGAEAIGDRACEMAAGNGGALEAPGTLRADGVVDDGAVHQEAVAEAEMRDGVADSGQVGIGDFVPLSLTGQEPATKIQNEIDGLGMNEDGDQEGGE